MNALPLLLAAAVATAGTSPSVTTSGGGGLEDLELGIKGVAPERCLATIAEEPEAESRAMSAAWSITVFCLAPAP